MKQISKEMKQYKILSDGIYTQRNIYVQAHCALILVLTGKKANSAAISDDISEPIIHCRLKIIGIYSPPIASTGLAFLRSDCNKLALVMVTVGLLVVRFFYVPAVFQL